MIYKILQDRSYYELCISVNKYIDMGYIPQGGLTIESSLGKTYFFQAMVKYDKPKRSSKTKETRH